jgi:hypothetical protein
MFQAAAKVAVFSVCLLAVTFPATAQSNYQVTGTVKWSVHCLAYPVLLSTKIQRFAIPNLTRPVTWSG